ncbi:unnamed protein product [Prunus brigantina]
MLSFLDGNDGYNQIMVAEVDIHKTAFMCPGYIGAFENPAFVLYDMIVDTYRRAMNFVFYDMIGHSLEVYLDDMVIKPILRGRIGKWTLALPEFSFRYVLADLLSRTHICLNNPIYSVHLTPWNLYFDGSKIDLASGA